jgi:hypothetical protein
VPVDNPLSFLFYVIIKFAAYSAWCYAGLRWLQHRHSVRAGIGFGFARLLLGVLFGLGIFISGGMLHLDVPARPVLMYFAIYAPVRYLEWTILFDLLRRFGNTHETRPGFLKEQAWIFGGIAVSHLADLPLILSSYEGTKGFLPVGRFLC